jgi:hypothetical protein
MKGMVFTELIEYVEENLGFEISDKMIDNADLPNNGVFTQAGNYPHEYLVSMVVALSQATGVEADKLVYIFGEYMFERILKIQPSFVNEYSSSIDFIAVVDEMVHVEVKKLYPDADLPRFIVESKDENSIVIIYQSEKRLEAFAKGLMQGCAKHFNQTLEITSEQLSESPYQVKLTATLV